MGRWTKRLGWWAFFALMVAGATLISLASTVYFETGRLAPFVIEKLPVRFEALWLFSLKLHVASALLAFPACLVLMLQWVQRRKPLHRWLGRVTGVVTMFGLIPSGIVLSFEAKGGPIVTLGFLLSAGIVAWAMVFGVHSARRGQLLNHAYAMRHVLAQMSVAVTSRVMLVLLDQAGMQPATAYVVSLWVPVLGSALVAELVSRRPVVFNILFAQFSTRSLQ